MNRLHPLLRASILAVVAGGMAGCAAIPKLAWFSKDNPTPKVRPIAVAPETLAAAPAVERLYPAAVAELEARRYGRAIEILQLARHGAPEDVRVLNALGVAYDKLGRFDLSGRYYALALKTDPASRVVRANMNYSVRLQGRMSELANAPPAPPPVAAPPPQPPYRLASIQADVVKLAVAPVVARPQPLLTGASLVIVDGTGRAGAADQVRVQLAARGWSVPQAVEVDRARWATSEIRYPAQHAAAATALARTLPFKPRMAVCADGCKGLRLTIGTDARWNG